jgi:hypothetical protein
MYLDDAVDLICDQTIREDYRDRLVVQYLEGWAAGELDLDPRFEEQAELAHRVADLIALAMRKQHKRTAQQLRGDNDPLITRERSAFVPELGIVRVRAARCDCGRQFEPQDFEIINDGVTRAVCPSCHAEAFRIELRGIQNTTGVAPVEQTGEQR